jgi:putative FmdB family regulatory protein
VPRYPFRCECCGNTFEVSRPMSDAGSDAQCPADGGKAVRVFTMPATNFNRPTSGPKPAVPTAYSHYGHTHGAGAAPHSHGPTRRPGGGAI